MEEREPPLFPAERPPEGEEAFSLEPALAAEALLLAPPADLVLDAAPPVFAARPEEALALEPLLALAGALFAALRASPDPPVA